MESSAHALLFIRLFLQALFLVTIRTRLSASPAFGQYCCFKPVVSFMSRTFSDDIQRLHTPNAYLAFQPCLPIFFCKVSSLLYFPRL